MEKLKRINGTRAGIAAQIMWAFMALMTVKLVRIPTFEVLSIALFLSFFMTISWIAIKKRWYVFRMPLKIWLLGLLGIFVNDAAYVSAFKYAPAVQVDLINYLWPILITIFYAMVTRKFFAHHFIGATLGFLGAGILVLKEVLETGFESVYFFGYLMALVAAFSWSIYVVTLKNMRKKLYPEAIGLFCGIGALFSLVCHALFETTVIPSQSEFSFIAMIGLTTSGAAYYLWNFGIRRGNFALLSSLSYGIPVASVALLILSGQASANPMIIYSSILVALGALIAGSSKKTLHYLLRYLRTLIRSKSGQVKSIFSSPLELEIKRKCESHSRN